MPHCFTNKNTNLKSRILSYCVSRLGYVKGEKYIDCIFWGRVDNKVKVRKIVKNMNELLRRLFVLLYPRYGKQIKAHTDISIEEPGIDSTY